MQENGYGTEIAFKDRKQHGVYMYHKSILTFIIFLLLITLFLPAFAEITSEGTEAIDALRILHPDPP